MEVEKGIWKISTGKGSRIYINAEKDKGVFGDLFGINGVLIYDYENLKDLAVAILKFEKERNYNNSIAKQVDEDDSVDD